MRCVALLRGINVGKAKRVTMADLRALLEGLGHTDVSTVLGSGNAVFTSSSSGDVSALAREIEDVIRARLTANGITGSLLGEALAKEKGAPVGTAATSPRSRRCSTGHSVTPWTG